MREGLIMPKAKYGWIQFLRIFFPAEKAGNMPEIAVVADFVRTFSLYFVVFFHLKTLITIPTIKQGSFLSIKLIFVAGTFLKLPEQPIFVGKWYFLNFFLELYFIFFDEMFHTDTKWQCLNCKRAQFSKNIFFRPKMPENLLFLAFSWDFIISFFWFFTQRCILGMLNTWLAEFDIRDKFFSGRIYRKLPFLQIFIGLFPFILLFNHTKTLSITMSTSSMVQLSI